MPITKEVRLYRFSELSEEAKEYAINKYREDGFNYGWYSDIYNEIKVAASFLGIDIDRIYFTGFYSQGDGACFEGSYMYRKGSVKQVEENFPEDETLQDIAKGLRDMQRPHFYSVVASVKHRGHYYHYNCTEISVEDRHYEEWEGTEAEEDCKELLRKFMRWMYEQLNNEWDYLSSDKTISELLSNSREHEYLASGKLDIE